MSGHILIVDDDVKLLEMLRRALVYAGYEVSTASDGQLALDTLLSSEPDLVILDWMLPGITGIELCRRIRKVSDMRILMLTAKDSVDDKVTGLRTGADDYLTKPFAVKELLARVEALFRRDQPRPDNLEKPEQLRFAGITLDTGTREVRRGDRLISLTTTEFELLRLFLRHPRQVLPRSVIMERVWGYDFSEDSNVLEVYIGYLRRKLEDTGKERLLHTVRGAGYMLREPTPQQK